MELADFYPCVSLFFVNHQDPYGTFLLLQLEHQSTGTPMYKIALKDAQFSNRYMNIQLPRKYVTSI
jgi:hypothetical protein